MFVPWFDPAAQLSDFQVTQSHEYSKNRTHVSLDDYICRVDLYTPIKLAFADFQNFLYLNVKQLAAKWRGKQLYKQHLQTLSLPCMDSYILSMTAVVSRCPICEEPNEIIEDIIDLCKGLPAQKRTCRHNDVAGIIH